MTFMQLMRMLQACADKLLQVIPSKVAVGVPSKDALFVSKDVLPERLAILKNA